MWVQNGKLVLLTLGFLATTTTAGYAKAPDFSLNANATSDEARRGEYERMKISKVEGDRFFTQGTWVSANDIPYYYRQAQNLEALKMHREAKGAKHSAIMWGTLPPAVIGAIGLVGGVVVQSAALLTVNGPRDVGWYPAAGFGAGLLLGVSIGLPMAMQKKSRIHPRRVESAEVFNRGLAEQLRLDLQPKQGGVAFKLSSNF